jgi:hypothetical protein
MEQLIPYLNKIDSSDLGMQYIRELANELMEKCFVQYKSNVTEQAPLPSNEEPLLRAHNSSSGNATRTFMEECSGGIEFKENVKILRTLNVS